MLAIVLLHLLQVPQPQPPRAVVAEALAAVEGDSASAVAARWSRRLSDDPSDREARLGLSTMARLEHKFALADSLYAPLETGGDVYGMYAALGRVWGDLFRAPFDATLSRALGVAVRARAAADTAAQVEALALAGFLGSRTGALPLALDTLTVAERMVPASEPWLGALVLCVRAPILSFGGRPRAWGTGLRGLAIARQSNARRMLGLCYQALSIIAVKDFDDAAIAEAYADSADAIQTATHDLGMQAITIFHRGYNRWAFSDLSGARQALRLAIRQGDSAGCTFAVAWSTRWLATIHWQAGDVAPALQQFAVAESLFAQLHDGFGIANLRNARGIGMLALGRVDEAEQIFRENLTRSQQSGVAGDVYTNLVNLASVQSARGDWLAARRRLEQAIAYGNANGHAGWTPSLGYTLGIVALRLGELDRADQYFRSVVTGPDQHLDRYAVRARLAEVAARRGDLDHAVIEMEGAARQLDSLREKLEDRELKLLLFQTRTSFDEQDLGLASIAELLVRGGRVADAFRLAEQRRARTLADQLLKAAFLRGSAVLRPVGGAGLPALSQLSRRLPEGTAVVEYLVGQGSQATTAYLLTANGVTGLVLPPAESLRAEIERFGALTERGETTAEVGRHLANAVFDPVLRALPGNVTRVIVIPDGALHRVPFDALPLEDGRPLLSRLIVSRAPSAVIALELLPRESASGTPRLLALADPRFPGEASAAPDPEAEIYRTGYAETGGLPRLPASRTEVTEAARFAPGAIVRLGDEASESFLKHADLERFQVIHFATHALVDEQSPGRSSLALAPGNGEDGFVGAAELGELHLNADLVVLSACRTAGGTLVGGEGVQGLTAPLLAAGARAVVATLWPIGDRRTASLVEDLYREMARGATVAEALQHAKRAARDRGESAAVWAAFTVVGDPEVRLPLVLPRPTWPWWLGVAMAAAILAGLIRARRRAATGPIPG